MEASVKKATRERAGKSVAAFSLEKFAKAQLSPRIWGLPGQRATEQRQSRVLGGLAALGHKIRDLKGQ